MSENKKNPKVDAFLKKAKRWQAEMTKLREIVLPSGLLEELKWYQPCYTLDGKNVLIISAFKEHCVLSFLKGALLKDPKGLLTKPGENTQSGRWIRFTNTNEITKLQPTLKAYIKEAIEIEKSGKKVNLKTTAEFVIPDELKKRLDKTPALKKAFNALTPGRQRGYLLYFSSAKQSETRQARIEKSIPHILEGKGLHD